MNKIKPILATASIALAVLLMFSCSSSSSPGNDVYGEDDATNSSETTNRSSSSSIFVNLADTTFITLKGTSAEIVGNDAVAVQNSNYGTIVEITGTRVYSVQGQLSNGFIAVAQKDINPIVILNGVDIASSNYAPIVSLKKSNLTLVLADGTTNTLSDGGQGATDGKYNLGYDSEEQPNATLLVRRNLTIKGTGKLVVNSKLNNGIGSRAILRIESGDIKIDAPNNALKGNDAVTITGGKYNLVSGNDGIKTEEVEPGLGNINISGGDFDITAQADAVQASTSLAISAATFKIKTGGGSNGPTNTESAKGIKAAANITINSGTFDIDSKDDAIHSDSTIVINNGTIKIATGDDAMHANKRLTINDGNINITQCYEGLEAYDINLNGGFIKVVATNDGINISAGKSSSSSSGNRPGGGGGRMGGEQAIDGTLTITGGEVYIEGADAIDSNGNIVMTGGTVVAIGPSTTNSPEVPIDFDGTFTMTSGTFVGLGNAGNMLQLPNEKLTTTGLQYSFLAKFSNSPVAANTLINVSSSTGAEVVTLKTVGQTRSMIVSSPLFDRGSYTIRSGGSHTGTANGLGLYEGGAYSSAGATTVKTITINSTATTAN